MLITGTSSPFSIKKKSLGKLFLLKLQAFRKHISFWGVLWGFFSGWAPALNFWGIKLRRKAAQSPSGGILEQQQWEAAFQESRAWD